MKIKEGYYQHKCLVCGDLYTAKGKISLECQECTIKRLEEELAKEKSGSEDAFSDLSSQLDCYKQSNKSLKQQLQEQENYVELGKAIECADNHGYDSFIDGQFGIDIDKLLDWYRNEVNNEA